MRKCTYCGKEYPDDFKLCPVDMQPVTSEGVPLDAPVEVYDAVPEQQWDRVRSRRDSALKDMRVGAIWFVMGLVVTCLTYSIATSNPAGGHYLICWGAVIFGAAQFFRGWQSLGEAHHEPAPKNTPAINSPRTDEAPLTSAGWTCRNCGEECESIFTSCWRCNRPRQQEKPEDIPNQPTGPDCVLNMDPLTNNQAAMSALKAAVHAENTERIRQLVRLYPELLNGADEKGSCPLHWAAENQSVASVSCLMDLGADPARKDQRGHTPEQVARLAGEVRMGAYTEACRKIVEKLKRSPKL